MKLHKSKLQTGFTIIEVMIVLAIAGLIMVIVFLAVPALQRSERDTHRKSIVDRISSEVESYASNNNGNIPNTSALTTTFVSKYLSNQDIKDPKVGTDMMVDGPTNYKTVASVPAVGVAYYTDTAVCNGETPTASGASARNYAIWIILESGSNAGYCLDNH